MPHYSDDELLLYHEKRLSLGKMKEIQDALAGDALLLARLMELARVDTATSGTAPQIIIAIVEGAEKLFTRGAVNLLRRDLVQLRGLPRPMTHSRLASRLLALGLTRTGEGYLLSLSGPEGFPCLLKGAQTREHFVFENREVFLKIPAGEYCLSCGEEEIFLSLA